MAKRKKAKRKSGGHRRRRVGAVHPAIMQTIEAAGGAALGAVAGVFVNQAIKTSFTTAPMWTGGAVCLAAGASIPLFVKPNPLIMGVSAGLAGIGGVFMLNESFLSLPGISGMPMPAYARTTPRPGYVNQSVAGPARPGTFIPGRKTMGNLSGNRTLAIGKIFDN